MITLEEINNLGSGRIINYDGEEALRRVTQYGYALQYVHNQTSELCLAAVTQNGDALQFVDVSIFNKEKKAVSGEFAIYKSNEGYILYDNDSNPINTLKVDSIGNSLKIGTIRLANIEIKGV